MPDVEARTDSRCAMSGNDPKFKKGDKVLIPFSKEIGTIVGCYPNVFDGWEYGVNCYLGLKNIHETNLEPATTLDEIVRGLDADS